MWIEVKMLQDKLRSIKNRIYNIISENDKMGRKTYQKATQEMIIPDSAFNKDNRKNVNILQIQVQLNSAITEQSIEALKLLDSIDLNILPEYNNNQNFIESGEVNLRFSFFYAEKQYINSMRKGHKKSKELDEAVKVFKEITAGDISKKDTIIMM